MRSPLPRRVWLTVLFVPAVRRNRRRLWLCYALVLMLSILVSINLVLLVPVYAAMLPLLAPKKITEIAGHPVGGQPPGPRSAP